MTDGSVAAMAESADDWLEVADAATRLGFDADTILRLIRDGDMPVIQIAGKVRTAHRVPRRLVDDAYAAVMAGAQVELRAFARAWSARNAAETAVA
jgi:excisionase family DNA binding protein